MKLLLKHFCSNRQKQFNVELPNDRSPDSPKVSGFYDELAGRTVALAAHNKRLFVVLDEKAIEVDESFSIQHTADKQLKKLEIVLGSEQFLFEYANDSNPVSTQYYSEDEEDSDFGLWLSNVLSSPERKEIILNSWTSADE